MSSVGPRRLSVLMVAANTGSVEAVNAVIKAISTISAGTKIIVSVYSSVYFSTNPPSRFPNVPSFHSLLALYRIY